MRLDAFASLIKSEKSASWFIVKACWKKGRRFCPRCEDRRPSSIRREKYRCRGCGYEFADLTGRYIARHRIPAKDWLWIIKLFELEVSALKASQQTGLSYPTVLRAFGTIRESITAVSVDGELLLRGEVEADESYFGGRRKGKRGRGAAGKVPVFGILEPAGKVSAHVVPNVSAQTVLGLTVKKVRRGSIVYTDKFRSYDSLMFCGYRHLGNL